MPATYVEVSVIEEEDDEQNDGDNHNQKKKKKKKKEADGNRFLIGSVSKAKKRIISKIRRKPLSPNTSSSSSAASDSSGFWKKVCFCGIVPLNTLDCSSSTSDPKNVNFTPEMLRVSLQTNDFFSKDCNPHL